MKSFTISVLAILLPVAFTLGEALPKGFEKEGYIGSLKTSKKADTAQPVNTASELIQISRTYMSGVKAENYVGLVTNHRKYGILFKEGSPRITNGVTTAVNKEKTEFEYALHVEVDSPFGGSPYEIDAIGTQKVTYPRKKGGEIVINNDVKRTEYVSYSNQTTRVIPWEKGILIEDRVQIVLKTQTTTASAIKKQLGILFNRFLDTFREELGSID